MQISKISNLRAQTFTIFHRFFAYLWALSRVTGHAVHCWYSSCWWHRY